MCIITDSPTCDVHLINDGFSVIDENSVSFQYEGTGPDANTVHTAFLCRIDNGDTVSCEWWCSFSHFAF